MEQAVRSIEADGLLWGQGRYSIKMLFFSDSFVSTARRVPVAFGLYKLEIGCVVEDDKVKYFVILLHYFSFISIL